MTTNSSYFQSHWRKKEKKYIRSFVVIWIPECENGALHLCCWLKTDLSPVFVHLLLAITGMHVMLVCPVFFIKSESLACYLQYLQLTDASQTAMTVTFNGLNFENIWNIEILLMSKSFIGSPDLVCVCFSHLCPAVQIITSLIVFCMKIKFLLKYLSEIYTWHLKIPDNSNSCCSVEMLRNRLYISALSYISYDWMKIHISMLKKLSSI